MRRISMGALLVVSILPAACKPNEVKTLAAGEVSIKIECLADDGVSFSLTPWGVLPDASGAFTFNNESSVVDIDIISKGQFPFNGQPHHAGHGGKAIGRPLPNTPKGRRYKYSVTADCPGGNRTVVIDPDMIIPN